MNILGTVMQAKASQATEVALIYLAAVGRYSSFRDQPVRRPILNPDERANLQYESVS